MAVQVLSASLAKSELKIYDLETVRNSKAYQLGSPRTRDKLLTEAFLEKKYKMIRSKARQEFLSFVAWTAAIIAGYRVSHAIVARARKAVSAVFDSSKEILLSHYQSVTEKEFFDEIRKISFNKESPNSDYEDSGIIEFIDPVLPDGKSKDPAKIVLSITKGITDNNCILHMQIKSASEKAGLSGCGVNKPKKLLLTEAQFIYLLRKYWNVRAEKEKKSKLSVDHFTFENYSRFGSVAHSMQSGYNLARAELSATKSLFEGALAICSAPFNMAVGAWLPGYVQRRIGTEDKPEDNNLENIVRIFSKKHHLSNVNYSVVVAQGAAVIGPGSFILQAAREPITAIGTISSILFGVLHTGLQIWGHFGPRLKEIAASIANSR